MKKWLLACVLLLQTLSAHALEISVGEGGVEAKRIAVVPFAGNSGQNSVDFIVATDLRQSGVFAPIDPSSYTERPISASSVNYAKFNEVGASYIVFGKMNGDNIMFSLADSAQKQVLKQYTVKVNPHNLRQAAHRVADLILEELTGTVGAFSTRIAYIHEKGSGSARRYFLMLADSDGANPIELLASPAPIMSPRFAPDGNRIAYVSFENQQAQIFIHDIYTGARHQVSAHEGMNSSPAWSPDGKRLALVLSKDGNAEVYIKNLSNGSLKRITHNKAIDTEPVFGPKGELYFTSDRNGSPQLYRAGGGKASRITATGKYSTGADISDDGNFIALARKQGGNFIIGTIDRRSNRFNAISQGRVDETPRFSPNGLMLIFTSVENNRSVLRLVNVDGSGTNTLSASGHIRDADWSPYLK